MSNKTVRFSNPVTQAGFTQVPNAVLFNPDLPTNARLLFAMLMHYAWAGEGAWPGQAKLGELVGWSERSLRQHLGALQKAKLIEVQRGGQGRPNRYVIVGPRPSTADLDRQKSTGLDRQDVAGLDRQDVAGPCNYEKTFNNKDRKTPYIPHEDFSGWVAHHQKLTGHKAPREGTKARQALGESYGARRAEGYSDAELRAASLGAFSDEFRRQHGHDVAESVLRPTKVASLIAKGEMAAKRKQGTASFVERYNRRLQELS